MDFTYKIEKLEGLESKIKLKIGQKIVNIKLNEIINQQKSRINLKGFRRGKVSNDVVKKLYGKSMLLDVANSLVQEHYNRIVEKEQLNPVGMPDFKINDLEFDKDLHLEIIYSIMPVVELANWDEVNLIQYYSEIKEKNIADAKNKILKDLANYQEEDRACKKGDRVNINFTGKIDNKEFEGGSAKDFSLELGSNKMIKGFEQNIVDMKKGETKIIQLTFPDDYYKEDLRKKDASFEITLNKVESIHLPKINEELFIKLGFKKEDEMDETKFTERIKKQMKADLKLKINQKNKKEVFDKLAEKTDFALPKNLVKMEANALKDKMKQNFKQQFKGQNIPDNLFPLENFMNEAEKRVRIGVMIYNLKEQYDIKATDEQVDDFLAKQVGDEQKNQFIVETKKNKNSYQQYREITEENLLIEKAYELAKLEKKEVDYSAL